MSFHITRPAQNNFPDAPGRESQLPGNCTAAKHFTKDGRKPDGCGIEATSSKTSTAFEFAVSVSDAAAY
jgi:hypothetical protein